MKLGTTVIATAGSTEYIGTVCDIRPNRVQIHWYGIRTTGTPVWDHSYSCWELHPLAECETMRIIR